MATTASPYHSSPYSTAHVPPVAIITSWHGVPHQSPYSEACCCSVSRDPYRPPCSHHYMRESPLMCCIEVVRLNADYDSGKPVRIPLRRPPFFDPEPKGEEVQKSGMIRSASVRSVSSDERKRRRRKNSVSNPMSAIVDAHDILFRTIDYREAAAMSNSSRAITALIIFATGLIVQGFCRLAVYTRTGESVSLGEDVIAPIAFGAMLLGIALVLVYLMASSGTSPPPRLRSAPGVVDAKDMERRAVKEPKDEREEWQGFSDDEQNPTSDDNSIQTVSCRTKKR
ncbi:hypothetical protein LTS10_008586 [Elasticomyces elasticus]|nr:hypothetical protein LTS10_008586 [Elasticomyces elasticus]